MNPNQALGLPERSMRAVMAFYPMLLTGALLIMNRPIPEWLVAAFIGSPAAYFGTRLLDTGERPPTTTQTTDLLEQVRGIKP